MVVAHRRRRRRCAREEWIGGHLPEKSTPNSFTAWESTVDRLPRPCWRVYALNCKRARLVPRSVGGSFKLRTSRTFCVGRLSGFIRAAGKASSGSYNFWASAFTGVVTHERLRYQGNVSAATVVYAHTECVLWKFPTNFTTLGIYSSGRMCNGVLCSRDRHRNLIKRDYLRRESRDAGTFETFKCVLRKHSFRTFNVFIPIYLWQFMRFI